jgi:hypothetical protein
MDVPVEAHNDEAKSVSQNKEPKDTFSNSNESKITTSGEKNISMQTKSTISCYSSCCGSFQKVKK